MSCVLRIAGSEVDVDALLAHCGLIAYRVDRKGTTRRGPSRGAYDQSCLHVDVSSADFDELPLQVEEAVAFLEEHAEEIRRAVSFPGVEVAVLDFAVVGGGAVAASKRLPPGLLLRAGRLGVAIELSLYPTE